MNVPELRKSLLEAKRQLTIANTAAGEAIYLEEEREIPVRDGSSIKIRIHSPKKSPLNGSPVFVVYHGGGFALGGLDNETLLCRNFAQLGGVAVNVDYRLSPENPFPVGIHDAYDALKWVQLPLFLRKPILTTADGGAYRRARWQCQKGIPGGGYQRWGKLRFCGLSFIP